MLGMQGAVVAVIDSIWPLFSPWLFCKSPVRHSYDEVVPRVSSEPFLLTVYQVLTRTFVIYLQRRRERKICTHEVNLIFCHNQFLVASKYGYKTILAPFHQRCLVDGRDTLTMAPYRPLINYCLNQ